MTEETDDDGGALLPEGDFPAEHRPETDSAEEHLPEPLLPEVLVPGNGSIVLAATPIGNMGDLDLANASDTSPEALDAAADALRSALGTSDLA